MLPALRLPLGAVAVIEQRREVGVGAHEDTAAGSAVSAVGPAFGDELFAPKRRRPRTAGAADDVDDGPIYEHWDERGTRNAERGADPRPPRAV